jgi:TPR repeat protein
MKRILIATGYLLYGNAFAAMYDLHKPGEVDWQNAKVLYVQHVQNRYRKPALLYGAMTAAVSAAAKGNAEAQDFIGQHVGWIRRHSPKMPRNPVHYFRSSVGQSDAYGLLHYGKYLIETSNTPFEFAAGIDCIRLSAEQGSCVEALAVFGCHLRDNNELEGAAHYFKLAADMDPSQFRIPAVEPKGVNRWTLLQGNLELAYRNSSQCSYAICLSKGLGVEKNLQQAMHYFGLAGDKTHCDTIAHILDLMNRDPEEAENSLKKFQKNLRPGRSKYAKFTPLWIKNRFDALFAQIRRKQSGLPRSASEDSLSELENDPLAEWIETGADAHLEELLDKLRSAGL